MGSQKPDERLYIVELAINGRDYRAELWRDPVDVWTLLEVSVRNGSRRGGFTQYFTCLKDALIYAEQIAAQLIGSKEVSE